MRQKNRIPQEVVSTVSTKVDLKGKTIHEVYLLDNSGSMGGSKFNNAVQGIKDDIRAAQETYSNIGMSCNVSLVMFESRVRTIFWEVPVKDVVVPRLETAGMTALYQAIGETLEKLINSIPKEDSVIVKVFSDGGENGSIGKYRVSGPVMDIIAKAKSLGYTITFVGTKEDTIFIIKNLKIDESNTLVHQNTGASVTESFNKTMSARSSFVSRMAAGEDVSKGYYKSIN